MNPHLREVVSTDWITILLVICFALYAVARAFYPRRFDQFAMLPVTNKYFLVHGKEDNIGHPFHLLLFVAQILLISLFILLSLDHLGWPEGGYNVMSFLQIAAFYTTFVLIKVNLEKIVGNAFGIDKLIDQYLFKKLSYRNYMALLVFGISVLVVYSAQPSTAILLVICALLAVFNISSLIYIYNSIFGLIIPNFFYFILYLCALEIAPYIILYKLLKDWSVF